MPGGGRPRRRGATCCPTSAPSTCVIRGLLGEGVAASTRFDPQAKGLGEWVRSRHGRRSRRRCCERAWSDEQPRCARPRAEFVRREVAPHLQEWEDAGEVPRALHAGGREAGLLGVSFPEAVGGEGGDLLDSVALQEAMFEAGASSGLMAALFTGGIALPHIAASGNADLVDRFVRPTLAGEMIGVARGHRARRRLRRRRHPHHAPRATATTTSSTAPRPSSPAASAPTSSPPPCAPAARATRGVSPARRREGHARLHRRPVAGQDGLALLRHRRAVVRRRAGAGRQPGRRGELRLRPDRRAVRGRADRAGRARLRHRRRGRST